MKRLKQHRYDLAYMKLAVEWSNLSYAKRMKVGAIMVKGQQIISDGFNGMPSGMDNCCEDDQFKTKSEVLHAEANAILKCARHGKSCEGATLYITLSPCQDCAKLIYQAGVKRVVYLEEYRYGNGLDFLEEVGIETEKITMK
jgi:dCMP deaminase|tara:strand:- start:96 stop:521 length:426 start_codon:yes stop_codon:yes gene_type:complete